MPVSPLETLLSIAIGLCLAAACGFRVFLPLAGLSAASLAGHLPLALHFQWLATTPAAVALGTATVAEVVAYYVPWLDHALDTLATPAAVAAEILATSAVVIDLPPVLKGAIALIGGGGAAGLIQGASVLLRLKSTALTGGTGNPVVATGELIGAATLAVLGLLVPLLGLALAIGIVAWASRRVGRLIFGRSAAKRTAAPT